jgi:AbrB family looped-hinge helix DNA binding protein
MKGKEMGAFAKITSKGQTTIPAEIRAELGVGPGDRLEYVRQPDGQIVVRKAVSGWNAIRGILKSDVRLTDEELRQAIDSTWGRNFR